METAAGLGALGFWIFVAAIIVAGIWYDARKKESQQETLRRLVESGKEIDPEVVDRIVRANESDSRVDRDLKIGGTITAFVAPGLALFAIFLGKISDEAQSAILGVSLLVALVAAGLLVASKIAERWYQDDQG